jgi:hypothetical protein
VAKRARKKSGLNRTAERFGAGLGNLATAYAEWMKQRDIIASELRHYLSAARKMLADMGHHAEVVVTQAVTKVLKDGGGASVGNGRRPGFRMSEEAKRKISEAAKARWAKKKGKKTRNVSPEVRAKLSRLAKERWAKAKKAGKTTLG